ncbi:MAG TPA: 3-hydroxyacyl-CoA dehydrogenase NAD-binding domain-containing protein [Casimicrobiaceae bacterium]|nr:3-hydroxyacyl-CoA dehydrogenase NAD-binding domain-containing protein [Casimicrobiaceae bacterium]
MPNRSLTVGRAAVLGAGVMGAQIAAHLVNAGIPVLLFDLPAADGPPSGLAQRAIENLRKIEPAPLARPELAAYIEPANYGSDLARLAECDLVVEAIAERMDLKRDLYGKIAAHVGARAVLASNTSGLSLTELAGAVPASARSRFCGVHFFNPPRYMHLVELVATPHSDPAMLDALETFLTSALGKGVIRARDTPNFIANRIGIFSVLATLRQADAFGLGYDVVDALTGTAIGRAKSATYRTADVVGLDTLAHVIRTMQETLPDDPWHALFAVPPVLASLIDKRALGQKTGAGFYRKVGKEIQVLDPARADYRPAAGAVAPEIEPLLALRSPAEQFAALRSAQHPQAQFLWAIFRDLFHYAAFHLESIADNARDVDLAIRWGFGWRAGPFETWQAAGWKQVADWIDEDRASGRSLAPVPLPPWVRGEKVNEARGVHSRSGAYAPAHDSFVPRSSLPVYRRQPYPDAVLGEAFDRGTTVFETDALRMWHRGEDVAIVSFRTKQNTVSEAVLDGLLRAIDLAESGFAALVIWQEREPFSLGANLAEIANPGGTPNFEGIESVVAKFQATSMRLRYSSIPAVAAVRGMALGGSVEFLMHCDRAVAAHESYIGLVETGVGLLPGGAGTKELALRASRWAQRGSVGSQLDMFPFLRSAFQTVAMATVSRSAPHARQLGFLRDDDLIVMNTHEVLHVAQAQARALAEAGYRAPLPARDIAVAGRTGIATLQMMLVNMREGGFISAHDYEVSLHFARALCGGDVDAGSLVDERWLLTVEREQFMELARMEKTHARIAHTLKTGKPLRN